MRVAYIHVSMRSVQPVMAMTGWRRRGVDVRWSAIFGLVGV
jgi:hypothetical protein